MAITLKPKAFYPTENAFTVCGEFDADTVAYIEYSKHSDFSISYGDSSYGFSVLANTPYTHLVPVDPDCGSSGDKIYYRIMEKSGSSFVASESYSVVLKRNRAVDRGWGFLVGPTGRNTSGSGLSSITNQFYLPFINSINADFICCPGNFTSSPAANITAGRAAYRAVREDFEQIGIPVFLSPGHNDTEETDTCRQARQEFFPCANLRTYGHQCIRAGQDDWQELESGITKPPAAFASVGSYFHFAWGNALFIHINDSLDGNQSIAGSEPDLTHASYANQTAWLEAVLREHRHKYKWCFTFTSTTVNRDDPDNSRIISGVAAAKSYLMGIHSQYKVTAHFHGYYGGWRVSADSNGTTYVCSNFGSDLGTADLGNGWHSEHGLTYVRIGSDENNNVDPDKIHIEVLGVGSGNEKGEVLNTGSENGAISAYSGLVVDHSDTDQTVSNINKSSCAIPIGATWTYNDGNTVETDDVDFITGSTKFYDRNFQPQMLSSDAQGNAARLLWKTDTAPFYSLISSGASAWGGYYEAHTNLTTTPISKLYDNPPWAAATPLQEFSGYLGNPIYFLRNFDVTDDIDVTEIEMTYNIKDVAFIWINGILSHHTSGVGVPITDFTTPFAETNRPSVNDLWVDENSESTLDTFEPAATDSSAPEAENSRVKTPSIQYESGEQPVKITDPTIINSLSRSNNVVAVLLVLGRDSSSESARKSKTAFFDLSIKVLGTEKNKVFSPQILSPSQTDVFNKGTVSIEWRSATPADTAETDTDFVTYDLEYTDNYKGLSSTWNTIKRRIPHSETTHNWVVGKSIKSNNVRIRMRSHNASDESKSNWSISDKFSINVFDLIPPAIISPMSGGTYSDFVLIILDEFITINTYHQKVRYTLEYSSKTQEIDWTIIAKDISVGNHIIRWKLDGVPNANDYILRLTVKNQSTSCVDEDAAVPDQISYRFVRDISIRQTGAFIIDTKPPMAILEVENDVTNQLDQIISIFAEDETTEVTGIRLRECDASGELALGNLEDPYDPLGGCASDAEIIQDPNKFGKLLPFNPKMHWKFEDKSGLKKIEAILVDAAGNTSLQEQIRVFLSVFHYDTKINDFIIVIEQRDQITIDDSQDPPIVIAEPAIFEVVYIVTSDRKLTILEPFSRTIWTFDENIDPLLIVEYNESIYVITYNEIGDISSVYKKNTEEPELLFTFTESSLSGKLKPTATIVFDEKLYVGLESGDLWSYDGISFVLISTPTRSAIRSFHSDEQYMYIGFDNSDTILLYNGTAFTTLNI